MLKILKKHKICRKIIAIVLIAAFILPHIPALVTEAADDTSYNVAEYKGNKNKEQWTYPTKQGKVFAGWYTDDTYATVYTGTTGTAVAKFVDEKVLTVKVQLKKNTALKSADTNIRFITSIDSLRYEMVEFDVKVPESNKTFTLQETTAYSSILVDDDELYPYNAKQVFETDAAEYFVVHSITGIPMSAFGHAITATPYWYTLDGTKVAGKPRNLTVNREVLYDTPFTDKVTINGNQFTSALDKWDFSEVQNGKLAGTDDKQTVYFKETGSTALLQAKIDYTKGFNNTSYPMYIRPRLIVTDGASTNCYNIRIQSNDIYVNAGNTTYEDTLNRLGDGSAYHVLRRGFGHPIIQFDVALKGDYFYVYVDYVFVTKIPKTEVVPNSTAATPLAFGLDVSVHGSESTDGVELKSTEYELSNIQFTTDVAIVDNYLKQENIFAKIVTVNGTKLTSAYDQWDTSALTDNLLKGSYPNSNNAPMYFAQTGNSALMQTEVAYTTEFPNGFDNAYQVDLFAKFIVSDGTNSGYIGIRNDDVHYTGTGNVSENILPYFVLRPQMEDSLLAVQFDIVLQDGYFYVYVEHAYVTKFEVSQIVSGATKNTQLAFGLDMRPDNASDFEFRNVQFTTDAIMTDSYLTDENSFARGVIVNGVKLKSAYDKWDTSSLTDNLLKGSYSIGSNNAPMYFAKAGNAVLMQTKVAYTTDFSNGYNASYQKDLFAKFIVSDGTTSGYIGIRNNDVMYGTGTELSNILPQFVLRPELTDSLLEVQLDVILLDGYFYLFVEGMLIQQFEVSQIIQNATGDTQLAFGLDMRTDNPSDYEFRNVQFTTAEKNIDTYINQYVEASGTALTPTITVNGKRFNSAYCKWDTSALTSNMLKGTYDMGSRNQTVYFKETGNTALIQAEMEYTTDFTNGFDSNYQVDLFARLVVTDGTNSGYIGIKNNDVHYKKGANKEQMLENVLPYFVLRPQLDYAIPEVQFDVVLKNGYFYLYVEHVYITKFAVSDIVEDATKDTSFAFGIDMCPDKPADFEFRNLQFTTNTTTVDTYLKQENIFAKTVKINGNELTSAYDKWDTSALADNLLKGSYPNSNNAPMYFAQTGNAALMQTEVAYTTDFSAGFNAETHQRDLFAKFMVSDGTNSGYIGIRNNDLHYTTQTVAENNLLPHFVLRPDWDPHLEVQFDVAVAHGYFYVFVDGVFVQRLDASAIVSNSTDDTEFAFGLDMRPDKASDFEFRNVQFTTDLAIVQEYLSAEGFMYVDYGTGFGEGLQYNSELYGMNGSNDIIGADPGAFYLSKDEDPIYGGYYYLYMSGSTAGSVTSLPGDYYEQNGIRQLAYKCFRSKDLYQWELAGDMQDGYSMIVYNEDWAYGDFWAPEVIRNPQDGKYYMYFSASSSADYGVTSMSSSTNANDRMHLGVAVSDSPTGPFTMYYDTDSATGKRVPTINFQTGCNTQYPWATIDASPFIDDDGTLYLYFSKSTDDHYNSLKGVWGMKMNSMTKPNYSTVSCMAIPGKVTTSNTAGKIETINTTGASYYENEGTVNEAPFMMKHNGKYYLTYAAYGCGNAKYSVHQAISSSPLTGFNKPLKEEGNPVLDGSAHGYMNGTAHHAFVKNDDELWIVYHRHNSTLGMEIGWDRSICVDRANFVKNASGTDVLTTNGPSMTLQWLPDEVSGYQNLAQTADITVSSGTGKEYLTDNILPYYTVTKDRVMTAGSNLTVTLKWNEPVIVSSVMVYSGYNESKAFAEVSEMVFTLDSQSQQSYAYIPSIELTNNSLIDQQYMPCTPVVAEFDAITVTELELKIQSNNASMELAEIVVLGGKEDAKVTKQDYQSFSTIKSSENIQIDGRLNEKEWSDLQWFKNTFVENMDGTMPTMYVTAYPTEEGIYIAAKADDTNLKNDFQRTMENNSAFEFHIVADDVGDTPATKRELDYLKATQITVDMRGDCFSGEGSGFERAVRVDGVINSGSTKSATMEAFLSWDYLQVDTTNGIPKEIRMYPVYRAVLAGDTSCTNTISGNAPYPMLAMYNNYWRFDSTGYVSADNATAIVGDAVTGLAKSGNWDVSQASKGIVRSSYGNGNNIIYFRDVYATDFTVESTIIPVKSQGEPLPRGGFCFQTKDGGYFIAQLIMDDATLVSSVNGTRNITKYKLITYDTQNKKWTFHEDCYMDNSNATTKEGVDFKVIKKGETFEFYADGNHLKTLTYDYMNTNVLPALFTWSLDAVYKNYFCN